MIINVLIIIQGHGYMIKVLFRKANSLIKKIKFCVDYDKKVNKFINIWDDKGEGISRYIFLSRKRYNQYGNYLDFYKSIAKIHDFYHIPELDKFDNKRLVVCGKGRAYVYTKLLLEKSKWKNHILCLGMDTSKLLDVGKDIIIVASDKYNELANELSEIYPKEMIYKPQYGVLVGTVGEQYFDVFSARDEEIVIDCGAFDGKTELDIINWGGDKIKKIYAFELDPLNATNCLSCYAENGISDRVKFINKGTGNINCKVTLNSESEGSSGSRIGKNGREAFIAKIDDEIDDKVTFIKMDVEGAELESIKGAEKTIKKYKPNLAICIYHKTEDLYEIPNMLLKFVPEYKFVIRHYTSYGWETVLYAYVK